MIKLEIIAYIIFMLVFTAKVLGVVTNRSPVNTEKSLGDKFLVAIAILFWVIGDMITVLENLKTFIESGFADSPIIFTFESSLYVLIIASLLVTALQKVVSKFSNQLTS